TAKGKGGREPIAASPAVVATEDTSPPMIIPPLEGGKTIVPKTKTRQAVAPVPAPVAAAPAAPVGVDTGPKAIPTVRITRGGKPIKGAPAAPAPAAAAALAPAPAAAAPAPPAAPVAPVAAAPRGEVETAATTPVATQTPLAAALEDITPRREQME